MIFLALFALFEGEFLNLGVDAGSWGRGATGYAYPSSGYHNPASGLILQSRVNLTGSQLFGGLSNLISGGINIKKKNYAANVQMVLHSTGDIHYTGNALIDQDGDGELDPGEELDTDSITYFSSREGALLATYAKKIGGISTGVRLKFLYKKIRNATAFGTGLDIGFSYSLKNYIMAAGVDNITTSPIFWEGRTEHIAPSYKIGLGMQREIGNAQILTEVDLIFDDYGFNHHLGSEIIINELIKFRFGFINEQLTAGAGISRGPFLIDYAVNIHRDLLMCHRISIGYNLQ